MGRRPLTLAAVIIGLASPALAATLVVNSTDDSLAAGDGHCTLREALANANANADTTAGDCQAGSGADVVEAPEGTYEPGGLAISDAVTLHGDGAGRTVIVGGIDVEAEAGTVRIERVTVTRGVGLTNGGADLTVLESVVSWSYAAGISHRAGTTTVVRSLIERNGLVLWGYYDNAAGGVHASTGTVRIWNSTITGNVGACRGPCVPCRGYPPPWGCSPCPDAAAAIYAAPEASVEIAFSTVADNFCSSGADGGAIRGNVAAKASLLSNPDTPNCASGTTLRSGGYNLDGDGSCGLTESGDQSTEDAGISFLGDHEGPTATYALFAWSPALDTIPAAACGYDHDGDAASADLPLGEDQRGASRPAGDSGRCDIGAYEGVLVNARPHALCRDVVVSTEAGFCYASSAPTVDAGSSDPDGDDFTLETSRTGGVVGTHPVTLRVVDAKGASDSCTSSLTVVDTEPPTLECHPSTIPRAGPFQNYYQVGIDNCDSYRHGSRICVACPTITSVECVGFKKNGKRIEKKCKDTWGSANALHLAPLRKKTTLLRWHLIAVDPSGNRASKDCEAPVVDGSTPAPGAEP